MFSWSRSQAIISMQHDCNIFPRVDVGGWERFASHAAAPFKLPRDCSPPVECGIPSPIQTKPEFSYFVFISVNTVFFGDLDKYAARHFGVEVSPLHIDGQELLLLPLLMFGSPVNEIPHCLKGRRRREE